MEKENNNQNLDNSTQSTTGREASCRTSYRLENNSDKAHVSRAVPENKGSDSIPYKGNISVAAEASELLEDDAVIVEPSSGQKASRLTRPQLEKIEERLSARDHAILQAIRKYRFLTSGQVGRLYVTNFSNKASQTRQQNLILKRLADYGLIRPLDRRIGGIGGGSSVQVWHLTGAGHRLLTLNDPGKSKRKRFIEPSPTFLRHTLAVAECAVQLTCICRNSMDLELIQVDTEPTCWRPYNSDGRIIQLKPDLFVITNYVDYEDRYFMEIDLGTESVSQVVAKCDTYLDYYHTDIEQRESRMFPLVVWIVKDKDRKAKLKEAIKKAIVCQPKLFLVITPDELERLIRQWIEPRDLL